MPDDRSVGLSAAYLAAGQGSFSDFLRDVDPTLLPGGRGTPGNPGDLPHGTTVVAVGYPGGVVMAGDRRATAGNLIAQRNIEKVFPADDYSCIGIAGTAGLAIEIVRLFQVELEHYEKIEGVQLSLLGKANRLSMMLRGNLALAMQGLAVVPLFAGFDLASGAGRIFSYDVIGGRYEEHRHHGVGSGSLFARGALKKLWRPDLTEAEAVSIAVEALYDAADDDSATGGPDLARRIFPLVATVDARGYRQSSEADLETLVRAIVERRNTSPDGPVAAVTEV